MRTCSESCLTVHAAISRTRSVSSSLRKRGKKRRKSYIIHAVKMLWVSCFAKPKTEAL